MTLTIQLTDSAASTTVLTDGTASIYTLEYSPRTPDVTLSEAESAYMRDGADVAEATLRNVVEEIKIEITGATALAIRTTIQGLEERFTLAHEYQRNKGGKQLWLELDSNLGWFYRSEVLSGRVMLDDLYHGRWQSKKVQATLMITRRFYWEGAEREIGLRNDIIGITYATGGVQIMMRGDTVGNHWVEPDYVDPTAGLVGVLPAPAKIDIENTYNTSGSATNTTYIGLNVWGTLTTQDFFEGEACVAAAGAVASTGDATCSGAYYQRASWSASTETLLIRWLLDDDQLDAMKGRWWRVMGRCWAGQTGTLAHVELRYPGATFLTTLGETPDITMTTSTAGGTFYDFGVLQFPPGPANLGSSPDLALCIYATKTGGGTVDFDYIVLMPMDRYRKITWPRYSLMYQEHLVDNAYTGDVYVLEVDGDKVGLPVAQGRQIWLWPNRQQRVSFVILSGSTNLSPAYLWDVRIWVRPRQLTI